MKKILAILALTFIGSVQAEEIEVPKLFIDSKIVVTLKNGKSYEFDGNKYMVVRRKAKQKAIALIPQIEKELQKENKEQKKETVQKSEPNKNRVRVMVGVGPSDGFSTKRRGDKVTVSSSEEDIIGVGYDRLLQDDISVNGQALSNGTVTLGLGLDF